MVSQTAQIFQDLASIEGAQKMCMGKNHYVRANIIYIIMSPEDIVFYVITLSITSQSY